MVQIGFTPRRGLLVSLMLLGLGCSPEITSTGPQTADDTIGAYCDELLPVLCTYAVEACGADGPVARCIDNTRPTCCQGACSRPARLVKDLDACKLAYAGRDAGVDDGGAPLEALPGRPCSEVLAGLSPEPCRDVVELLSQAPVEGAR